jgi:hypothetical protein
MEGGGRPQRQNGSPSQARAPAATGREGTICHRSEGTSCYRSEGMGGHRKGHQRGASSGRFWRGRSARTHSCQSPALVFISRRTGSLLMVTGWFAPGSPTSLLNRGLAAPSASTGGAPVLEAGALAGCKCASRLGEGDSFRLDLMGERAIFHPPRPPRPTSVRGCGARPVAMATFFRAHRANRRMAVRVSSLSLPPQPLRPSRRLLPGCRCSHRALVVQRSSAAAAAADCSGKSRLEATGGTVRCQHPRWYPYVPGGWSEPGCMAAADQRHVYRQLRREATLLRRGLAPPPHGCVRVAGLGDRCGCSA